MKNRQDSIYLIVIISTGILFLGIIMYSFKSSVIYEGLVAQSIGKPLSSPNPIYGSVSGSAFTNQQITQDESINSREIERPIVKDRKPTGYFIRPSNNFNTNDSSSPRIDFDNSLTEESLKSDPSKQKYRLGSTLKNKSEDAKSSLQASKSSHERDSKRFSTAQDIVVSGSGIRNGTANEINP